MCVNEHIHTDEIVLHIHHYIANHLIQLSTIESVDLRKFHLAIRSYILQIMNV